MKNKIYKANYIEQKTTKSIKTGNKDYILKKYNCTIPREMAEKIGLKPDDLDIRFIYNEEYNLIVIQKV